MSTLGERIKELRESIPMSLSEFSDSLGVYETTIESWESGAELPPTEIVIHLCVEYNMSVYWLLLGNGNFSTDGAEDEG